MSRTVELVVGGARWLLTATVGAVASVFPFYVVVDTSTSMRGGRIESVNAGLPELHRSIASDPVVSEKCRLAVLSFNTEARIDLPLSDLSEVQRMPMLEAGGRTNYKPALDLVESVITRDVAKIRRSGDQPLRSCVFFITDGRPTDAWKTRRDLLVDRSKNRLAPHLVPYGVAEADSETLERMTTGFAYLAKPLGDAALALREVFASIANSVVSSTRAAEPQLVLPETNQYFTKISIGLSRV